MVFDCFILFSGKPAYAAFGAVFRADAGGPGEGVVDLDEVVVLDYVSFRLGGKAEMSPDSTTERNVNGRKRHVPSAQAH